ncbi:MAG: metallophosphoesterase, partial [Bacteroidales bacterium]
MANKIQYSLFILFFMLYLVCSGQQNELVILHTNDTHSQIEPYQDKKRGEIGGYLRRYELIKQLKAENSNILILDAGDFSQGTPYFNLFKGFPEIEMMSKMGYRAVVLGNHEFDNGTKALAKRLKKASFDVVCANYTFKDKALQKIVKPYIILEINHLKIGIFGLTVNLEGLAFPEVMKQVEYHDAIEIAKKIVPYLKNELKCDIIICLSHLGLDDKEGNPVNDIALAKAVDNINII